MRALRLYLCASMALVLVLCQAPAGLARADAPTVADAVTYWHRWAYPDVSAALVTQMIALESGGDPTAYNPSGASGVLQFLPSTWAYAWQMEMDDTTYAPGLAAERLYDPMSSTDIWSAWDQVHLAYYLIHEGHACWWVSYQTISRAC